MFLLVSSSSAVDTMSISAALLDAADSSSNPCVMVDQTELVKLPSQPMNEREGHSVHSCRDGNKRLGCFSSLCGSSPQIAACCSVCQRLSEGILLII